MSRSQLLLREGSRIHHVLREAALNSRCVFFAGLPGVGKTLMIQQFVQIARAQGRSVDLLQWDVARGAFETPAILTRFPEVRGITHAAIRRGVGLWAREAVSAWDSSHQLSHALLVGETPLIGNRLVELARPSDDAVEALLASSRTVFLVPTPTTEVRAAITNARAREMADPRHQRELSNASSEVVDASWLELQMVAGRLGLTAEAPSSAFDPDLYATTYLHLLRHRSTVRLDVDELLPVQGSAYEMGAEVAELRAEPAEVDRFMAGVAQQSNGELEAEVASWFQF